MNGQTQIYLPRLSKLNKIIIIATSALFILNFILGKSGMTGLESWLGLSVDRLSQGHLYLLLTYPFMANSIIELILNCLMLWLMGSEFESNWGMKRYSHFLLSTIIGGAIVYALIVFIFFQAGPVSSFPLMGLSGIVGSLCLAYAVIYPDRIFSFLMVIPVKAKYFCMLLVAISLFQGLSGPYGVGAWGQLGAILSAYVFMMVISHRNFRSLSQKISSMAQSSKAKKGRAKLSIVKDDNDNPPKY